MQDTITGLISSTFGISTSVTALVVSLLAVFTTWVLIYLYFGSTIISALPVMAAAFFLLMIGFIPPWVAAMIVFLAIASMIWLRGGDSPDQAAAENMGTWEAYGEHIKEAYAAKFGGRNPGFEDEVDKRIKIMQNLGRGFTRTLTRDWLRRMEKFTEANKRREA